MKQILVLFILLSLSSAKAEIIKANSSSHCALTKNLGVDDLVTNAGIIFRGTLDSVNYGKANGIAIRELRFKVSDPIKGVNAKVITLNEWAASRSPFVDKVIKNKPYVFFFHEPSELGLTSLIGMEQGLVGIDRKNHIKFASRLELKQINNQLLKQKLSQFKLDDYQSLKDFCYNVARR